MKGERDSLEYCVLINVKLLVYNYTSVYIQWSGHSVWKAAITWGFIIIRLIIFPSNHKVLTVYSSHDAEAIFWRQRQSMLDFLLHTWNKMIRQLQHWKRYNWHILFHFKSVIINNSAWPLNYSHILKIKQDERYNLDGILKNLWQYIGFTHMLIYSYMQYIHL